jgi:molybdopterin synthase sulfur carrier subunit
VTTTTSTITVTVRYFAAARAAAGMENESLRLPAGSTVNDTIAGMRERHGEALTKVLGRCSFLLDEVAVRDRSVAVPDGALLDVLPPFAGG